MTRLMSFSMTTEAYRRREKTVTRRDGWWFLKPGDIFMGVEKAMGLKKGEHIVPIHPSRVVSTTPEPLNAIETYPASETVREGFPDLTRAEFVTMFADHNRCAVNEVINRIEFKPVYVCWYCGHPLMGDETWCLHCHVETRINRPDGAEVGG